MNAETGREEVESVIWVFDEVRAGRRLPVREAEAIVYCLHAALLPEGQPLLPPAVPGSEQSYVAVNALNVSRTAMTVAQSMQLAAEVVRTIGMAGLLHDIGMVRISSEVLDKNAHLTDADRAVLMRHPEVGAAIIFEAESAPDIVAVAAYEHHIRPDGTGYPALTYSRNAHRVSRLIAVCSGYHALTSARPFRPAWSPAEAVTIIEAGRGRDYDVQMVGLLAALVRNGK
jgi:HD-GYP domain-containing protein (c-di-GMP phosphodiesterase class II)